MQIDDNPFSRQIKDREAMDSEGSENTEYWSGQSSLDEAGYESCMDGPELSPIYFSDWATEMVRLERDPYLFPDTMNILGKIGALPQMVKAIRQKNWFRATVLVVDWLR